MNAPENGTVMERFRLMIYVSGDCLVMVQYPFPDCCEDKIAFLGSLLMSFPLGMVVTTGGQCYFSKH